MAKMRNATLVKVLTVYRFICSYKRHHDGNSPSRGEIVSELGYSTKDTAQRYIKELERRGLLVRHKITGKLSVVGATWEGPEMATYPAIFSGGVKNSKELVATHFKTVYDHTPALVIETGEEIIAGPIFKRSE